MTDTNRRFALLFGIIVPLLQLCRTLCFGGAPRTWLDWPIAVDAYVVGALLIVGAWKASRSAAGKALVTAGWGFACGIFYRTTFEQLGDPARRGGVQSMVLVFKALLFVAAIGGFVGAILSARSSTKSAELSRAL